MTFFAPASITAFFSTEFSSDPLKTGSTGVGITLEKGVYSKIVQGDKRIKVNGKYLDFDFETLNRVLEKLNFDFKAGLEITSEIPAGCGFGFSGASCLSSAFEINDFFKKRIGYFELADIVHECEVLSRTGLGDVVCQSYGGVVLRKKAGSPSKAVVEKYLLNDELSFLVIGPILTSDILKEEDILKKINFCGREAMKKFITNPSMEMVLRLSKEFAIKTGLMDDEVSEIISEIERRGFFASMVMLGKVIFSNCPLEVISEYGDEGEVFTSKVSQFGVSRVQ